MKGKFVFIHTPRTAGGTINHILRKKFPNDVAVLIDSFIGKRVDKIRVYYPNDYYIKSVEEVRHFPIITGHIPFYKVAHFNRPFVTWLRHPVERVISHYNAVLSRKEYKYDNIIDFTIKTRNLMTYFTGGDINKFDFIGITENFDNDIHKMFDFELGQYNNIHVSNSKLQIDNDVKNFITEVNEKDMLLYEKAQGERC
jgi:hypothetical protein